MTKVSVQETKEKIQAGKPLMIDFYADWCGPCKMLSPMVEALSQEFEGRVEILKINVDDAREFALEYSVMSIPTLIGFKGGKILFQEVGFMPKSELKRMVEDLL